MTSRDFFIAGCRLLAVYILWTGLEHVLTLISISAGYFRPEMSTMPSYALHGILDLAVGTYLLGATGLANLLFRRDSGIERPRT